MMWMVKTILYVSNFMSLDHFKSSRQFTGLFKDRFTKLINDPTECWHIQYGHHKIGHNQFACSIVFIAHSANLNRFGDFSTKCHLYAKLVV